jgi:hypothetical protein
VLQAVAVAFYWPLLDALDICARFICWRSLRDAQRKDLIARRLEDLTPLLGRLPQRVGI